MNASMYGRAYAKAYVEAMLRFPNDQKKARQHIREATGIMTEGNLLDAHDAAVEALKSMEKRHRRQLKGKVPGRLFWKIWYFFF